jgi:hypothetical protein
LLGGLQRGALGPDGSNDILQVADAAGQPVNAADYQHVAFRQELGEGDFSPRSRSCTVINTSLP